MREYKEACPLTAYNPSSYSDILLAFNGDLWSLDLLVFENTDKCFPWTEIDNFKDHMYDEKGNFLWVKWPTERKINNSHLAGQQHSLNPALVNKYPDGVWYKPNGFPDFSPYSKKTVKVNNLNWKSWDFGKADEIAWIDEKYRQDNQLTWHHHEDCKSMLLVPRDLHNEVKHTWWASFLKNWACK